MPNLLKFAPQLIDDPEMLTWIKIVIKNYYDRKTWHSIDTANHMESLFCDLELVKKALKHSINMYPNDLDARLYKIIYGEEYDYKKWRDPLREDEEDQ